MRTCATASWAQRASALLAAVLLSTGAVRAEDAENLDEALAEGDLSASLRYLFESVEHDGFDLDAHASTLRLTLGYATKPLHGMSVRVEFENVTDLGLGDQHNNAGRGGRANGVTDRPVIADPELTELHQVMLRVEALPDTVLHGGRSEITLGNQRFVGPVGWRQHHQSFDAVGFVNGSLPRTTLRYDYVAKVHRIFGDSQPTNSHLVDAVVDVSKKNQLSLYAYRLVYDREADAGLSTTTLGGRFAGSRAAGAVELLYDLELAHQGEAADNPAKIDVGYFRGELGLAWRALRVRAGLEVLEGNPERGRFSTPLATLHIFNGWADEFLQTPRDGLEDRYLALGAAWKGLSLAAVYHLFDANDGGARYGQELDLRAVYQAPWKQQFGVKLAAYDAESFATDTTKLWLWSAYRF